jgi:hypothetical protein
MTMAKKTRKLPRSKRQKQPPAKQAAVTPALSLPIEPVEETSFQPLPNVWQLTVSAYKLLARHWRIFLGITLTYGLLNLILVQGFAGNTDVSSLKHDLSQVFNGHLGTLGSSLGVFVVLVGSAGNGSSQTAGAYQLFLALITSLAVIWALRQLLANHTIRLRDAYYRGMYTLIPFILVLMIVSLQLLPLLIGSSIYSLVITNGIAISLLEKAIWLVLFLALAAWSLYMISASLFGLYIVTLPDMTPLKATRSAKDLVKGRRLVVLRKILYLPLLLLVVAAIIMVPIIIWLTPLAQWVFFLLTMFSLIAIHTYMYNLYRELLNE